MLETQNIVGLSFVKPSVVFKNPLDAMPVTIAKIQSSITDLLPLPPILTRDQCEILSEADNVVSNNHLTLKDLDIKPKDVQEEMKKWLWRYKDGGQFAKA